MQRDYKRESELRADDNLKLCQEIDGLREALDKARTQRDAMFHEIETLRGKTGFCPMCVRLTEERDKLRRELDEMNEAAEGRDDV